MCPEPAWAPPAAADAPGATVPPAMGTHKAMSWGLLAANTGLWHFMRASMASAKLFFSPQNIEVDPRNFSGPHTFEKDK